MIQKIFTWGSIFLLPFMLWSQQEASPFGTTAKGVIPCATVEHMNSLRHEYPDYPSDSEFETWLALKMDEAKRDGSANSRMILTIPVVFHVIHNGEKLGEGLNIPAANVYSQIEILNEDFRKKVGTPGFNTDPVGADVEIEFCPAFWGPDSLPLAEPGINRIDRNTRNWPDPSRITFSTMEDTIKPATSWNPDQYFNIWVTQIGFNRPGFQLLGYAQFPSGNTVQGLPFSGLAQTDGVVILYSKCGRVNRATGNGDQGRTLTHEVGHWLGLRHTWGDGPCGVDDFCSDTPESDSANYACNQSHISCGSIDMVTNYMDYTPGRCKNIFTECQRIRMRTVMLNAPRRVSLLNSHVCDRPTTAPIADFVVKRQRDCDKTIAFSDASDNLPTSWFWTFGDGNSSSQREPRHTYTVAGTYTVRLVVNNSFGNAIKTQTIAVAVSDLDAGPNQQIQLGDSLQLSPMTTSVPQRWQWTPLTGFANPVDATQQNPWISPTETTSYRVKMIDIEGCEAEDSLVVEVDSAALAVYSGGQDLVQIQPAFPNPADAQVYFTADFMTAGSLQIDIYDLRGKKVKNLTNEHVKQGKWELTWQRSGEVAAGLYLVAWRFEGRLAVQKIQLVGSKP